MTESTATRLWIHAVLATVMIVAAVQGQVTGDSHEFTGKTGQKLVAKMLGVSEDRRQMRILRQDGMEFDTEIVIFSLDDQQYVKDWMKANASGASTGSSAPAMGSGAFRLEVSITRVPGKSDKHRSVSYTMEEKESLFRINVRNLSRETLTGAKIEHAVVWKDSITVYFDDEEKEWEFSSLDLDSPKPTVKKLGEAALEPLRFNGEDSIQTSAVGIDEVFLGGNELYGQDELLGLKVRVLGADGAVLHESDSGGAAIAAMSWDEIKALEDPQVID
jgi:hypothetical protein